MLLKLKSLVPIGVFLFFAKWIEADSPCAPRPYEGASVVCVCNETYCDDITRDAPQKGFYLTYTSSKEGLRFQKSSQPLDEYKSNDEKCCATTIELYPGSTFQTIEGFGAAVTDAAAINWKNLSEPLQKKLINSYFGDNGLQYNLIRVPIGGSDFSTHAYAYNELPENDTKLTNFSLIYEDFNYKIPMIKEIMRISKKPIQVVATTWSPPVWMKTNHKFTGRSSLKPEFFQTYADYHYKFIDKYAAEGIRVWAITTTNEPSNGVIPLARFNSLGWSPDNLGKWIINNLGPTIRNSSYSDVKILTVDDQRYTIPYWFGLMMTLHPKALDYVDGVAVHYYGDVLTPASFLTDVGKKYPGKIVLATEACAGSEPWELEKVSLGSWRRAKNYMSDIIEDLNHDVVGWMDWNLCLDKQGGPTWAKNFVDSAIIVYPDDGEFIKQPMFYAMGHFSKFVPKGSRKIATTERKWSFWSAVEHVAFLTPEGTVVVVLHNSKSAKKVRVKLGTKQAVLNLEADSFTTIEMSFD